MDVFSQYSYGGEEKEKTPGRANSLKLPAFVGRGDKGEVCVPPRFLNQLEQHQLGKSGGQRARLFSQPGDRL